MFLADVVGTVVSPVQVPVLEGEKLLILRPVTPDGRPTARTRVGIDRAVGALLLGSERHLGGDAISRPWRRIGRELATAWEAPWRE